MSSSRNTSTGYLKRRIPMSDWRKDLSPEEKIADRLNENGYRSILNFVRNVHYTILEKEFPWAYEEDENE
jgi:hypothetical protein